MMELADTSSRRGGTPEEPIVYKKMYLDRLWDAHRKPHQRAEVWQTRLPKSISSLVREPCWMTLKGAGLHNVPGQWHRSR